MQRRAFTQRPVEQIAAAVRTNLVERVGAVRAEGTFERADEGAMDIGRQVLAALFAIGSHLKHIYSPAATRTASQIISTI